MTWKELRDAIDKMAPSQLDKEARCWREDQPLVSVTLHKSSDAQVYVLNNGQRIFDANELENFLMGIKHE